MISLTCEIENSLIHRIREKNVDHQGLGRRSKWGDTGSRGTKLHFCEMNVLEI